MSKIDYQALREKAEKATKGSYIVGHTSVNQHGNLTGVFVCQKWKGEPGGVIAECHVNCLIESDAQAYANAEFIAAFNPNVALALLDERERNQQYIKRRDQENEEIALTVGKLRVELEAAENNLIDSECHVAELEEALRDKQALLEASEKRIAELESGSQAQKLVEAIIVAIENEQERLFDEDYLMDSKECIDVIREEVKRWNDSRAAGIRIKGDAGEQNDEKP
ncbi:ead/Ea22-like family protein [Escherichia coli]|nr:ead/Ea22-like family protein [Escherichia coli]